MESREHAYLSICNLCKSYHKKEVIKNINIELERGRLLCLLGESGSGKSTILKAIGGFIDIDGGRILLGGRDITDLAPQQRNISTVFQSYGLFPHMNVEDNITYGLRFRKVDKRERARQCKEILEKIGLEGYEKKRIWQLSGGEQQRVALARSLIVRPKLLLLDEPLSNLDAKRRMSMREEIKRIQKEFDLTTVFVTHDQEEAFEIADRIVLLGKGKVLQEGSPREIYQKPSGIEVLDFIGHANHKEEGYVRPEKIKVYRKDAERKNSASAKEGNPEGGKPGLCRQEARLREVIFKGALTELCLSTKEGEMRALLLSKEEWAPGEELEIEYELKKI